MENTATISSPSSIYSQALPPASRILGTSISFYLAHWQVMAGISAIPFALSLVWIFAGHAGSIGLFIIFGILSFLGAFAARLALFDAVTENGEPAGGVVGAYQKGIHYFFPFVWVSFLAGFTALGGTFLLLIPGLLLSIWLSLSLYVLFAEKKNGVEALTASWHYVKGFWGPVFWRLLFLGLVLGIFGFLVNIVAAGPALFSTFRSGLARTPEISIFGQVIGLLYNNFFVFPIGIIYTFVIYRTLKDIKSTGVSETDEPKFKKAILIFIIIGIVGLLALAVLAGFLLSYLIEYLTNPFSAPAISPAESALNFPYSSGPASLLFSPFTPLEMRNGSVLLKIITTLGGLF